MGVIYLKTFSRGAASRASVIERAGRMDATALDTSRREGRSEPGGDTGDEAGGIEECPALSAFSRVCRANDIWSTHIPGEFGDARAVAELDEAYEAFFNSEAQTIEGLRLQFETLLAAADVEEDGGLDARVNTLIANMRSAFTRLRDIDERG